MTHHRRTIAQSAQLIYDGFQLYNEDFARMTNRAHRRFEQRDWKGHQKDIVARVDLYEKSVRQIMSTLQNHLGPRVTDHELWNEIRWYY
ncbi:MAG: isocitrate dehydrogenase kinase/phosphatase AceK regulatory subunit, partial [Gammaproteobacteria bacterium]